MSAFENGLYVNHASTGDPGLIYGDIIGNVAKENELLAYCATATPRITHLMIYDLHTSKFTDTIGGVGGSNNYNTVFSASGKAKLKAFISKAKTNYGILTVAAVRNIYNANGSIGDGTEQCRCTEDYNQGATISERFDYNNIETECWNFPTTPTAAGIGTISTSGATATLSGGSWNSYKVGDFISNGGNYRQIIKINSASVAILDRAFPSNLPAGSAFGWHNTTNNPTGRYNSTVDYATYLYRVGRITALHTAIGLGTRIEPYISRNSSSSFLTSLGAAIGVPKGRILLTCYTPTPSWDYMRSAAISIAASHVVNELLAIISVEQPTFYAGCDVPTSCIGSPDPSSNFSGRFFEGKNNSDVVVYPLKGWQDSWDYIVEAAPYTNTPAPKNSGTGAFLSYNEETNSDVQNYIQLIGQVIFNQNMARQLVMNVPPIINLAPVIRNVTCNGGSNGSIALSISNGSGDYSYTWSNGSHAASLIGIPAGIYSVTVHDNVLNVDVTLSGIVITQPAAVSMSVVVTHETTSNNGSFTITASGGTTPYSYEIEDSLGNVYKSSSNVITGLRPDTYIIRTFDKNLCTTTSLTRVIYAKLAPAIVKNDPACFNGLGSAFVYINPGSGTITYLWSTTETTNSVSDLAPGNYSVVVTSNSGQSVTLNFTIVAPTEMQITGTILNASSPGASDGSITLLITDGTPGYTVLWSNGQTGLVAVNLVTGIYTATVTDYKGCTKSVEFAVTEPIFIPGPEPSLWTKKLQDLRCCIANMGKKAQLATKYGQDNAVCLESKFKLMTYFYDVLSRYIDVSVVNNASLVRAGALIHYNAPSNTGYLFTELYINDNLCRIYNGADVLTLMQQIKDATAEITCANNDFTLDVTNLNDLFIQAPIGSGSQYNDVPVALNVLHYYMSLEFQFKSKGRGESGQMAEDEGHYYYIEKASKHIIKVSKVTGLFVSSLNFTTVNPTLIPIAICNRAGYSSRIAIGNGFLWQDIYQTLTLDARITNLTRIQGNFNSFLLYNINANGVLLYDDAVIVYIACPGTVSNDFLVAKDSNGQNFAVLNVSKQKFYLINGLTQTLISSTDISSIFSNYTGFELSTVKTFEIIGTKIWWILSSSDEIIIADFPSYTLSEVITGVVSNSINSYSTQSCSNNKFVVIGFEYGFQAISVEKKISLGIYSDPMSTDYLFGISMFMKNTDKLLIPVEINYSTDFTKLAFQVWSLVESQTNINEIMKGGENVYIYTQDNNCLTQAEADEMMEKAKHICNDCQCN